MSNKFFFLFLGCFWCCFCSEGVENFEKVINFRIRCYAGHPRENAGWNG